MIAFLWGVVAALSAVATLFFFKFWRQTRDALFGCFAVAFGLMSLHFALLGVLAPRSELQPYGFLLRLAAFLWIIAGVIAKNRGSTSGQRSTGDAPPTLR